VLSIAGREGIALREQDQNAGLKSALKKSRVVQRLSYMSGDS